MSSANRAPDSNVVALPVTDAERQRRYRERLRSGALIAKSTVPLELAEQLIDAGLLAELNATDKDHLGQALLKAAKAGLARLG